MLGIILLAACHSESDFLVEYIVLVYSVVGSLDLIHRQYAFGLIYTLVLIINETLSY